MFAKHSVDLLTVHGRTVKEMYRSEVHYEYISRAAASLSCPVLANGNIHSARKAEEVLKLTGARGLMIGRGAIRNPWLFLQVRQHLNHEPIYVPRGRDVLAYVRALYETVCSADAREVSQVQRMKKYLNYLALGAEPSGQFLHPQNRPGRTRGATRREPAGHPRRPSSLTRTMFCRDGARRWPCRHPS